MVQKRGSLFWGGLCYQKISTQALPPATAHVPICHIPPYRGRIQAKILQKRIFLFISPLPPQGGERKEWAEELRISPFNEDL
jgi:hypothetical protein